MNTPETQPPASLAAATGSALLPIEQPEQITGKVWFFCRGISHSGAKYGVSLHVEEVKNRLRAKAGAGDLIEVEGTWFWMPNTKLTDEVKPRSVQCMAIPRLWRCECHTLAGVRCKRRATTQKLVLSAGGSWMYWVKICKQHCAV